MLHGATRWRASMDKAVLATLAANVNSISVGMSQGYSAVLLPQLNQSSSDLPVTEDEASWIAALGVVSNPLGALLAGILMDLVGRNITVKLSSIPYLAGWVLIAMAQKGNIIPVYVGRLLTGLAIGMATAIYIYVAEVSPATLRGPLTAMAPLHVSIGVLLVYILGFVAPWRHVAALATAPALISLAVMCLVPESPPWLVSKGRHLQAKSALLWLRSGDRDKANNELEQLIVTQEKMTTESSLFNDLSWIKSPGVWKPFIILVIFFAFQEGSGIYILLYYAVNLFESVGIGINEYVASIIVASLRLIMSIIGSILIAHAGRKSLAVFSGLGLFLSMLVAGTYEYIFNHSSGSMAPLTWLPLVCVLAHVCVSMVGFLPLPWLMTSELFPLKVRGLMGGLTTSIAHLLIFTSVKTYPNLLGIFKMAGVFWIFASCGFFGALFCFWFLPETKGKSLAEIEAEFCKNKSPEKSISQGVDNRGFIETY